VKQTTSKFNPEATDVIVKIYVAEKMVYLQTSKDHTGTEFDQPIEQLATDIKLSLMYNLALNQINDISKMISHNTPPRCLHHRVHTLVFVCQLAINPTKSI
jgi:hypothetical protein